VIPDLETSDVHLKGPPAQVQRGPFHQQLVLREDRVASVARFAVAWSTPDRSDAVMRQATVIESLRRMRRRRASWSIVGLSGAGQRYSAKFTGVPASGDANP
jgi:hypothetical protein